MTILAIGIPLFMAVGAIAAFIISRNRDDAPGGGWQDDSLDTWREERDEAARLERETRADSPPPPSQTSTSETATEDEHQTFERY